MAARRKWTKACWRGIAETQLGDPLRWHEIYALNDGRTAGTSRTRELSSSAAQRSTPGGVPAPIPGGRACGGPLRQGGLRTDIPSGPEPHNGTRPLPYHIADLEQVAYGVPPQIDEVLAYENYRRVKVRWVTPLGEHVASISKRCSSSPRSSHRRSPRPRTMGTTAMCM